ncbi:periplasmic heavy metal sensor [Oceanicola sp. 502str15]|uniref:periplasmic heavy metal sensor n=1 Tax=Oceanicola sp. 502str15 TaxID=2696061 RepID=UPI0020960F3A|nr:periplasmic heavy metal sensor [Oceanicola sp. 502str15]MCO6382820.1 periplasmic heavy metal sensor [Oceanicola sp. 502str15]
MTDLQPPLPDPANRPRRWLRVVLVLSLAANLAVAGLVLGAWITHDGKRGPDGRRGDKDKIVRELGFGPYARAIPRENREDFRAAIEARRDELRASRSGLRSAFEATLATLRAEPFDRAAMAAQMEAQRSAITKGQRIGHEILLDRLASMSPEERAAFADRLERGLGREPGKKKGD